MLTDKEIRNLSLDGLKQLSDRFEELNLTYYLAYGTLLGAARHQGFIPWDDDIDIWMPRKDYNWLIRNSIEVDIDQWELLSYEGTSGYTLPWAKFCNKRSVVWPSRVNSGLLYGCSIDIFPLDTINAIDEKMAMHKCASMSDRYRALCRQYKHTGVLTSGGLSGIKRLAKTCYFNINCVIRGDWECRLSELETSFQNDTDDGDFVSFVLVDVPCIWLKSDFNKDNDKRLNFEGYSFRVPTNWDGVLTRCYGDYMTLPPISERVSKHQYDGIYWI